MVADFSLLPEQASTAAPRVDALYAFLWAMALVMTTIIAVLIIGFAVRFRRRDESVPPRIEGSLRLEIAWTLLPLVVGLVLFVWGASAYFALARPPDDALEIYVVARQWMWKAQHPGGQREIDSLHVPRGRAVKLTMISEDVIHSFYVPAFRIKQDVLPGRTTVTWFEPTRIGRHRLFCAEYCGTEHSLMGGWVEVLEPADYEAWLSRHADGSPASDGNRLFRQLKCISCHSRGGEAVAPLLEDLYGRTVPLDDGTQVVADDAYIRRSILEPRAQVVAGYRPIMPSFKGQVTEEQILDLTAFIRSLGPGQAPPRVEETTRPAVNPEPR